MIYDALCMAGEELQDDEFDLGETMDGIEPVDDLDELDDLDDPDDLDDLDDLPPPGPSLDDIEDIDEDDEAEAEAEGILSKGPEIHIGGDDEYDEDYSRPAPAPRQRSSEEEDARARARARAERNRLKKLAMQEMGAPKSPAVGSEEKSKSDDNRACPREPSPEEPKPKRDYINQQDWQRGRNGGNRPPMTAKTFLIGFGISVLSLGVLAMLIFVTYDIYDKRFGSGDVPEEVEVAETKKSKLRIPAGLTDHFQGKDEEEEDIRDPLVPPSQQEEEMFERSALSNISDDGMRAIYGQLDLMKRELRQAQKRQERIENAVGQLRKCLIALGRVEAVRNVKERKNPHETGDKEKLKPWPSGQKVLTSSQVSSQLVDRRLKQTNYDRRT